MYTLHRLRRKGSFFQEECSFDNTHPKQALAAYASSSILLTVGISMTSVGALALTSIFPVSLGVGATLLTAGLICTLLGILLLAKMQSNNQNPQPTIYTELSL